MDKTSLYKLVGRRSILKSGAAIGALPLLPPFALTACAQTPKTATAGINIFNTPPNFLFMSSNPTRNSALANNGARHR